MEWRVLRICEEFGGFSLMRAVWLGALSLLLSAPAFGQQQPNVPDAPAPQAQQPADLGDLKGQVTPGRGTAPADQNPDTTAAPSAPAQAPPPDAVQGKPPEPPPPGLAPETGDNSKVLTFHIPVTTVEVPVTVRDKHGNLIPGLPHWRFKVYEDGVEQRIVWFTTDAYPLSVAFVIDATLPADIMQKVNDSLSAVAGSLTPADTVAVISYAGTSPQLITNFTGAQGQRLSVALEMAKKPGDTMGVPVVSGPFASGPTVNGQQADPTLAPQHGNASGFLVVPKEVHPLNDAILYAAEQLASQPLGRRRVIYVISDGKNVRSKASYKEVVQYLLTNNISVYGTQVGDSAIWGIGSLDRFKLPLMQPEDVLPRFCVATGGDAEHQLSENGIQNAFTRIAASVRTAYTLWYNSHQPTISGKYHAIDVHVEGLPGLTVIAKQGYYPSASQSQ